MEEGLLSLKWNNHKSTFFHNLSLLREKHTYTDVTLACDGRLYPVHKFILSTCSEYFSDIFNSNNGNNIVIVLKDVRRQDLEYLLDYMYLGQVDVAQSELSSLIKTAECLKIKGLAIPDDEPQTSLRRVPEERERDSSPPSKKKRHHADDSRPVGASTSSSNNISSRIQPVLTSPPLSIPTHTVQQQQQQQVLLPRLPALVSQPQLTSTSQPSGKLHLSSQTHAGSPRTLQITTGSSHSSNAPSLSSPTQPSDMPVIKEEREEVVDTSEGDYGNDNFEDTKPVLSESQRLEQDLSVAGPSGMQGSSDNWDGESDLSGFAGGDTYPEGGIEEAGDTEAQGDAQQGAEDYLHPTGLPVLEHNILHSNKQNLSKSMGLSQSESVYSCSDSKTKSVEDKGAGSFSLTFATKAKSERYQENTSSADFSSSHSNSGNNESSSLSVTEPRQIQITESSDEIIYEQITLEENSKELPTSGNTSLQASGAFQPSTVSPGSQEESASSDLQSGSHLLGYDWSLSRYVCRLCGRDFDRISNLKRHVLLHSGVKPFKCLYCNYRAIQKVNVVQHVASRHRDEMKTLLNNNINVNDMLVPTTTTDS